MKKIIERPYLSFWILTSVFFIIGLINRIDYSKIYTTETNIEKDVILKVEHIDIVHLVVTSLAILGIIYWILQKQNIKLRNKLNLTHIILTFVGIIFLIYPGVLLNLKLINNISVAMRNGFIIIIIGLFCLTLNIILGIKKGTKKTYSQQKL